jgi:hypothetical protein
MPIHGHASSQRDPQRRLAAEHAAGSALPRPLTSFVGRERIGYPHEREEAPFSKRTIAAWALLGEGAFDAAWDADRRVTVNEALADVDALVAIFSLYPVVLSPDGDVRPP